MEAAGDGGWACSRALLTPVQDLGILGRRPTGREEHRAGGRPEREGGWLPLRFGRGVLGALDASICGARADAQGRTEGGPAAGLLGGELGGCPWPTEEASR